MFVIVFKLLLCPHIASFFWKIVFLHNYQTAGAGQRHGHSLYTAILLSWTSAQERVICERRSEVHLFAQVLFFLIEIFKRCMFVDY